MSHKQRFEYKNSISINSLVKLVVLQKANKEKPDGETFDHHASGITLTSITECIDRYRHEETVSPEITKVFSKEKESIAVIYDIREGVKKAINNKKLQGDDSQRYQILFIRK